MKLVTQWPNFLVVGAAKSGTTALYNYLPQHPDVFMSRLKEPRFFSFVDVGVDKKHPILSRHTVTTIEEYLGLFDAVSDEQAFGEASPSYLHNSRAPENIKKYIPDVKLIAILRDPAERAFSHYLHFIKGGFEPELNFSVALSALDKEISGWKLRHDYITFGYYGQQLSAYYELFDEQQIKVILFDDFKVAPSSVMKELYGFIGVDDSFKPDMAIRPNVSGIPKSRLLQDLLSSKKIISALKIPARLFLTKRIRRKLLDRAKKANLKRPELDPDVRSQLISIYREDIGILESLINRDLSAWTV